MFFSQTFFSLNRKCEYFWKSSRKNEIMQKKNKNFSKNTEFLKSKAKF